MFSHMFVNGVWATNKTFYLKKYCYNIQKKDKGIIKSNKGGYQSNNLNLKDRELQPFISYITHQTNTYANKIFSMKTKFKITNMWVNINQRGNSNHTHMHPFSSFSGVYYIQRPENSGNITFVNPQCDLMNSFFADVEFEKFDVNNCEEYWYKGEEGDCILFPSYYKHYVTDSYSDKDRISLSFNLVKE